MNKTGMRSTRPDNDEPRTAALDTAASAKTPAAKAARTAARKAHKPAKRGMWPGKSSPGGGGGQTGGEVPGGGKTNSRGPWWGDPWRTLISIALVVVNAFNLVLELVKW